MGIPQTIIIPPGGHLIDNIHFADYWGVPEWVSGGTCSPIRMRAVYAPVREDMSRWEQSTNVLKDQSPAKFSERHDWFLRQLRKHNDRVWVGRIATRWESFAFVRYDLGPKEA
jgi:hypothetical protein